MNAQEIVNRLERVSKTHDGWVARCPAHEDDRPSLSVGAGEDGRVLLRCFAGCALEDIVAALRLEVTDLFPRADALVAKAKGRAPVVASSNARAARWLRDVRGFPESEVARMLAAETRGDVAIVFRYVDQGGKVLYDKFRPIGDRKTFWRVPRGRASVLYGLGDLDTAAEQVVVVEGELDFHALRAVGIGPVVSVPDGVGSRLTADLLQPLAAFRTVVLATDADSPGDELAARLEVELGAERCRRVRFVDGERMHKDANDALRAAWNAARFEEAFAAAASPMRQWRPRPAGKTNDVAPDSVPAVPEEPSPYRVVDGQLCRIRHDRDGNEATQVLANFDARIFEETAYDDGAEVVRAFRVRGRLANGGGLPDARVTASEFGGLNWVPSAWGARALVTAGQGAKDHLRAAIQVLSEPVSRVVFRHTGWREHDGRWVYLYQGGGVGTDDITVELDPPLDRFVLPPVTIDLPEAVGWSLRLLEAAPASIAIPLLAATYAAPLSFIINPDFALWLVGPTGSLKSELAALAQRHFGTFDRKTLPGSWTSTENALEARLFTVKDAVAVIDDYAPNADSRAQQELEKRAQRIIRGVGNRASRGRLRADLTQQPDRPPRGMVVCTGEDLPTGHSILARLVIVEVDRERLNLPVITELQTNGHRFAHAMRGYIEWLQPLIPSLRQASAARVAAIRQELYRVGSHLRQAEALALLRYAFNVFLEFAEDAGKVDAAKIEALRTKARETLEGLGEEQGRNLRELEPAERFIVVIGTLLEQRRVRLAERGTIPREDPVEVIGWYDHEYAYLMPDAARRRVATFMREAGEAWAHSTHALHRALVRKGFAIPGADGRPEVQVRMSDARRRVLRMPLAVLRGVGGPALGPGPAPVSGESGAGAPDEIPME